jgi:hypothetical protein
MTSVDPAAIGECEARICGCVGPILSSAVVRVVPVLSVRDPTQG